MEEEWRTVQFNGQPINYEVSSLGNVRNKTTKKILKFRQYAKYAQGRKARVFKMGLGKAGAHTFQLQCYLVANAFIPNPDKKPVVRQKDGDPLNSNVENLYWDYFSTKGVTQYDRDGKFIATYRNVDEACLATGATPRSICDVCRRLYATASGFQWRDSIEELEELPPAPPPSEKPINQYSLKGEFIASFDSLSDAAFSVNSTLKSFSVLLYRNLRAGKPFRHKGYEWRLVEDIVQDDKS